MNMEILKNFGIEPTLLLAQIVNFLIILFVLKKFFYKPITKALDDRKRRIEQSLKNADEIEEKLKKTEEKTTQILEEARNQAQSIIQDTTKEAERILENANLEARKTAEDTITSAREDIEKQKEQMQKSLEKETLTLVAEVVKKILGRNLNQREKQDLTSKAISDITKQVS